MKTRFEIRWSKESKIQFDKIVSYLRKEWTEKEVKKFISKVRDFEKLVLIFPEIFAETGKTEGLRRAVLSKHNSVIYKIDRKASLIRVYTIFDTRQHPDKLK